MQSEPGKGTEFDLYLPAAPAARSATPPPCPRSSSSRRGRVLLVDDVESVRTALGRALADAGFEVEQASSAGEALALPATRIAGIDVLVTDVVMPGCSGVELASALLERRPALPVLLISGDLRESDPGKLPPHVRLLHKPFTGQDLADAVGTMLEPRPATP